MSSKESNRNIYAVSTVLLMLVLSFAAITHPIQEFIVCSNVEAETEKCDPKAEKTLLTQQEQSRLTRRKQIELTFLNRAGIGNNDVISLPANSVIRDEKDRKYYNIPILRAPPIA